MMPSDIEGHVANRPPDGAVDYVSARLLEMEATAEREYWNGRLWKRRYRGMCRFSLVAVPLAAFSGGAFALFVAYLMGWLS